MCLVVDRMTKVSFSLEKLSVYPNFFKQSSVTCILKCHSTYTRDTNLVSWVAEVSVTQLKCWKFNSLETSSEWGKILWVM